MSSTEAGELDLRGRMAAELRTLRIIADWEAGAKALALLEGSARAGVLDLLRDGASELEIAAAIGMKAERVCDLCAALQAHGIAETTADGWKISERFAPLLMTDALRP